MQIRYYAADILDYIDLKNLYQFLSVGDPGKLSAKLRSDIERERDVILRYAEPLIFYKEYENFSFENERLILGDVSIESRVLSLIGRDSFSVFVFVLTVGDKIEDYASSLYGSNQIFGFQVADAYGSVFAEATADCFMHNIEHSLPRDLTLSARFSPGYCDIPIVEQVKIFNLIGEENRLIRLTDSYQMVPQKSISGIFFKVSQKTGARYKNYYIFCKDCNNKLCRYYKR